MWICTSNAFLSVVAPTPGTPAARQDLLVVRARMAGHIEATFKGAKVNTGEGTDYAFRALIPRDEVARVVAAQVRGIRYGNFKSSVKNKALHDAFMRVWTVMFNLQETFLPRRLRKQRRQAHIPYQAQRVSLYDAVRREALDPDLMDTMLPPWNRISGAMEAPEDDLADFVRRA